MCFYETKLLGRNQQFVPHHLDEATISHSRVLARREQRISIHGAGNSTLLSILNAVEICKVKKVDELPTYGEDGMLYLFILFLFFPTAEMLYIPHTPI